MVQVKYYIGRRYNPQLKNPYFRALGRMTKKTARERENCVYGEMVLTAYDTEEDYKAAIENLKAEGYNFY